MQPIAVCTPVRADQTRSTGGLLITVLGVELRHFRFSAFWERFDSCLGIELAVLPPIVIGRVSSSNDSALRAKNCCGSG